VAGKYLLVWNRRNGEQGNGGSLGSSRICKYLCRYVEVISTTKMKLDVMHVGLGHE
jgi:hypothetical protein